MLVAVLACARRAQSHTTSTTLRNERCCPRRRRGALVRQCRVPCTQRAALRERAHLLSGQSGPPPQCVARHAGCGCPPRRCGRTAGSSAQSAPSGCAPPSRRPGRGSALWAVPAARFLVLPRSAQSKRPALLSCAARCGAASLRRRARPQGLCGSVPCAVAHAAFALSDSAAPRRLLRLTTLRCLRLRFLSLALLRCM